MDKMTFASYRFKPSDVIEGLNRYFAESKAFRYRRVPLEIRNGVWTSNPDYRKDVVFTNSYSDASVTTKASGSSWKYYLICDPEEVVGVAINWLREEHDIFYAPPKADGFEAKIEPLSSTFYCCDSKLVTETQRLQEENKKLKEKVAEQQKKIDSYEATLSKITDIMQTKYAGPAWSETWDDLVERIKRMKEKVETLEAENAVWMNSFEKAQDSRSAFCKKLKEALNVDYRYPGSFPKMEEDILAEAARLKEKAKANDFYVESGWEADYRAFVQRIFEAVGTPCVDEVIHTNYLAEQALEAVKGLKAEHDDARGLSLKIEELEEKLKHANAMEVWYRRTNRELVMERDRYRALYEDLERSSAVDIDDLNEWRSALGNLYEDVMNEAPDFDSQPTLLTKRIYEAFHHRRCELDKLSEFKAKLAEIIKLPEDKKGAATTEDYISSFEHTKGEWRKMEIKLANYERENKRLLVSNGAFDVLRHLHDSIIGPCDFDDSPQILGVRIISRFNGEMNELRELEQKLEDIKDICDGNSDVMNIIG